MKNGLSKLGRRGLHVRCKFFDAMVEEAIHDGGGSSSTADVNDDKDDKIITPCA